MKIRSLLSRHTAPYLLFSCALMCIVSGIVLLFLPQKQTAERVSQTPPADVLGVAISPSVAPTTAFVSVQPTQVAQALTPTSTPAPTQSYTTQTTTQQPTATPIPTMTPTPPMNKISVNITIDGSGTFIQQVTPGATQCDVLSQARADGKISNLIMKYDQSLGSMGVYVIGNKGKENSIWWTYTVNGTSPRTGCDHVPAQQGDTVQWTYIGS